MNADYVLDMIGNLDAETVELALPEGGSTAGPIVVTGATFTDRRIAIMPQRY